MYIALGVIIIVLLVIILVLLITGRKNSGQQEILDLLQKNNEAQSELLRKNSEDQRESVQKQMSDGTMEQFKRFDIIQSNIQGTLQQNRQEMNNQLRAFQGQIDQRLVIMQQSNTANMDKVNTTLEAKMKSLQDSNEKRLEQMQGVVDEKLQKTLETRLTQSFELVSKQLDSVQQGLGEMKNLAADTKSLKNALINVKDRGTYGEVRLEKLLSDILAPSQYEMNVEIADNKRVEFAVKLPGNGDTPMLLPIDSKFPIEDYNRLLDAEDKISIDEARKALKNTIRKSAKDIHDKYIVPPKTTDFALLFLPTEGLYAEVIQDAALFEELRDKYKVTVVGATTLSAFLNSLQMGFKTLAIEQRSLEVWDTLRAVKSEFVKFEGMLDKARKQIQTADATLGDIVGVRTRSINRKLREVEEFDGDSALLLGFSEDNDVDDELV